MNQKQVCTTLGVSSLTGACGVPAATSPWAPGEGNEPSNTHPQPVRRCPAYHPCRLHLPMLLPPAGWTALLRGQARPRMGTRRTPGQPTPLPAPSSPKEPAPLRNVACKQPLVSPEGLSIPQHLLTPCLYHCHRQHLCGHSLTPRMKLSVCRRPQPRSTSPSLTQPCSTVLAGDRTRPPHAGVSLLLCGRRGPGVGTVGVHLPARPPSRQAPTAPHEGMLVLRGHRSLLTRQR